MLGDGTVTLKRVEEGGIRGSQAGEGKSCDKAHSGIPLCFGVEDIAEGTAEREFVRLLESEPNQRQRYALTTYWTRNAM